MLDRPDHRAGPKTSTRSRRRRISLTKSRLPSADRLLEALNAFQTALTWPETQKRIQALLERGLQRDSDFENRWPALLGTLLKT